MNLDRFKTVIFAGFFALTESEKEIFKSLMKRENTLLIFHEGEGIKRKLSDLGILIQRASASTQPVIHCYKSPDTHGQVLGVGTLLKNRMDKKERIGEDTVIVLPSSETLLPPFHQALTLLDPDDYNVSLGYPLQRTPLFGFFNNLMDVLTSMDGGRLYVPHYLEFVLHPYTKNIYLQGRADLTRVLFHAVEEALTEKRTKKFLSLQELESDEGVISSIKEKVLKVEPGITLKMMKEHLESIHGNTIRKMISFKNVGDFAKKLREVIEYIYRNSTARLHPLFYPYLESFVTQLDLLSKSLMKDIQFQDVGSYFRPFQKVYHVLLYPFRRNTPARSSGPWISGNKEPEI